MKEKIDEAMIYVKDYWKMPVSDAEEKLSGNVTQQLTGWKFMIFRQEVTYIFIYGEFVPVTHVCAPKRS